MDIQVTFKNGRWVTDPSPAVVAVGTKVRWVFRAPSATSMALRWRVSFVELPFGGEHEALEVKTELADLRRRMRSNLVLLRRLQLNEEADLNHRGATEPQTADRAGEFKYDLSVEDASSGEPIGNDDPWLIVVHLSKPIEFYVANQ